MRRLRRKVSGTPKTLSPVRQSEDKLTSHHLRDFWELKLLPADVVEDSIFGAGFSRSTSIWSLVEINTALDVIYYLRCKDFAAALGPQSRTTYIRASMYRHAWLPSASSSGFPSAPRSIRE